MSLFSGGGTAGSPEDASVFSRATRNEFQNIDYNKLLSGNNTDNESGTSLTSALKEFFSLEKVQKQADKDGDGKVSADEAKAYVEEIAAKDGNAEDLTINDFAQTATELGIELTPQAETPTPEAAPTEEQAVSQVEETSQTSAQTSAQTPAQTTTETAQDTPAENNSRVSADNYASTPVQNYAYSAPVGNSSNTNYSSQGSAPADNAAKEVSIENMTLDQLKTEKETRVKTLDEKNTNLKNVQQENTETIKAAKQDEQQKKTSL